MRLYKASARYRAVTEQTYKKPPETSDGLRSIFKFT